MMDNRDYKIGDCLWTVSYSSSFEYEFRGCFYVSPGYCKLIKVTVMRIAKRRRSKMLIRLGIQLDDSDRQVHVTGRDFKESWAIGFKPDRFRASPMGAYQSAIRSAKALDPEALTMIKSSRTKHRHSEIRLTSERRN